MRSRRVRAVSMARSEYPRCPPRLPLRPGVQAAIASEDNPSVTSAAANEGPIVRRPARNAVLRPIRGMNLRLHACSVAPAERPQKRGPSRPTGRSSCNNAPFRQPIVAVTALAHGFAVMYSGYHDLYSGRCVAFE